MPQACRSARGRWGANAMSEKKPDDAMSVAEDNLEVAQVLVGKGRISDQEFLERMARSDRGIEGDGETCGLFYNIILGAQVAREMLAAGEYEDVVSKWSLEARRRWENGKFFKLYQEEK